uniref:Putative nucleolar complex protein 14 n=1 Tax=Lygus hesperus TaxID=30085 RepID=A0A0A9XGB5_LYGHE
MKFVGGSSALDKMLSDIEDIAVNIDKLSNSYTSVSHSSNHHKDSSSSCRTVKAKLISRYVNTLSQLHTYALQHPREVGSVCKNILIEAEKDFLRGKRNAPSTSVMLYSDIMTHLFPLTDHRHSVITPLMLFICSLLMQMKLTTLHHAHHYVI